MGLTSFVLELGQVVEKNMKDRAVVASLVIVSALFHVVCFILLVIPVSYTHLTLPTKA